MRSLPVHADWTRNAHGYFACNHELRASSHREDGGIPAGWMPPFTLGGGRHWHWHNVRMCMSNLCAMIQWPWIVRILPNPKGSVLLARDHIRHYTRSASIYAHVKLAPADAEHNTTLHGWMAKVAFSESARLCTQE